MERPGCWQRYIWPPGSSTAEDATEPAAPFSRLRGGGQWGGHTLVESEEVLNPLSLGREHEGTVEAVVSWTQRLAMNSVF